MNPRFVKPNQTLPLVGDIFLVTTNWKPQNYSSTNKYEHKHKTKVAFKIISLWFKHQTNIYFQLKPNLCKYINLNTCRTRSLYSIGYTVCCILYNIYWLNYAPKRKKSYVEKVQYVWYTRTFLNDQIYR